MDRVQVKPGDMYLTLAGGLVTVIEPESQVEDYVCYWWVLHGDKRVMASNAWLTTDCRRVTHETR